uniref:Uncharacterized protein n=1 Tax=viral metagenome TaxID=1070528 RepID=A0A6M3IRX3_9ZZZZ
MWEKVVEYTNPAWYSYNSEYTKAVVTFQTGPEQLTWLLTDPIGEYIGNQIKNQAQSKGQTILFYYLQKNTEPTLTTYWQIDIWGHGSPLAAILIVGGALAALGIAYFSMRLVSSVQATKQAEIQQETEQVRIDFVEKYEPVLGTQATQDLLNGVTSPTIQQTAENPTLLDDLKDVIKPAVTVGSIVIIGALLLYGMQYLPKPRRST